jgi:hypothetical protein
MGERYAVVSCHVERPLDDRIWERFSRLQARRRIAALVRPPAEEEDAELWLERAREAAARGPLGHHTHWGGPSQARPTGGDPAARVHREGKWLREQGLKPTLFCGGGWYIDAEVAAAVADLGYADCTATAFRPNYLAADAPRLGADGPCRLGLRDGRELLELPTTHSLGMLARALPGRLPRYVHVYFHDTDLLDRLRAATLEGCLRFLTLRAERGDLDELARRAREQDLPLTTGSYVQRLPPADRPV